MDNPPVGAIGPVAGLLTLLLVAVAALFAGAIRALRWRDGWRFSMMAALGTVLAVPVAGLLVAFFDDPRALAWRWPTGFTVEWRCDQNRPQWAPVCLRRSAIPPESQDSADKP